MILSLSEALSILDPGEKIQFAIALGLHHRFIWRSTNITIIVDGAIAFGDLKA